MGTVTERLAILIDADGKGAVREFDKLGAAADKSLGTAGSKLDKLGAGLTSFGTKAVAASAIAGVGLYKLASAAGDYGETVSAAGVIFGDAAGSIQEFGEEASKTAGLSKKAAVDGANTFGTFGKAAGLAGEDLAGFSTGLVQLAGDFASFKNTTPEEAIEAIGAALRGEMEPIRKYGVLLDDAALKHEALSMGIYNGTGVLTSQQKILAAQSAILKQSSDATGDYARTSDSFANQQRTLTANLENLKVEIGEGVLPVFSKLVSGLSSVAEGFNSLPGPVKETIGSIGAIGVVGVAASGGISLIVGQAIKARAAMVPLTTALTGVSNVSLTGLVGGLGSIPGVAAAAALAIAGIKNVIENNEAAAKVSTEVLKRAFDTTDANAFKNTVAGIGDVFAGLNTTNDVEQTMQALTKSLGEIAAIDPQGATQLKDAILGQLRAVEASNMDKYGSDIVSATDAEIYFNDAIRKSAAALQGGKTLATNYGSAISGLGTSAAVTAADFDNATDAVKALNAAIAGRLSPLFAVIEAQNKMDDVQRNSAKASADSAKEIGSAQRSLADAYGAVGEARKSAAERVIDAAKTTADAEQRLADAQDRVRSAQENLTRARQDAADGLKALSGQVQDAELSQRGAALSLERAQEALAKTNADPTSTDRERREAQLAYEQAARGAQIAGERVDELKSKRKAADEAGVDGSQEVRDAFLKIIDANDGVIDAEDALSKARKDQVDAAVEGQKRIADAVGGVADAQRGLNDARSSGDPNAYEKQMLDEVTAAQDLDAALRNLDAAVRDGKTSFSDASGELERLRDAGLISDQTFQRLRDKLTEGFGIDNTKDILKVAEFEAGLRRVLFLQLMARGLDPVAAGQAVRNSTGRGIPLLAKGGPVKAGESVIVGDGGEPELFTPGASGFITPFSKMRGGDGASIGGVVLNLHFHGPVSRDSVGWVADQVQEALDRGRLRSLVPG